MTADAFRMLLVEDNEADACLIKKLLRDQAATLGRFTVDTANTLKQALPRLSASTPDVVLLDLRLPDSQGLDTLRSVRCVTEDVPVVVITCSEDAGLGIEALKMGAQDFLEKNEISTGTVVRALRFAIERRSVQRKLLESLREKEVLLHELNHRAKNNLQVVTSLLAMQARRSDDPDVRSLIDSARERIDSMKLAHEQLHASSPVGRVDFSSYLQTLANAIYHSHDGESRGIRLELELGQQWLALRQAVTAGLVVNELLTNVFKHAFPNERRGTISLRLSRDGRVLSLTLEDDGVGWEKHGSSSKHPLGLELVSTLAQQLSGRLTRDRGRGTRVTLSFPGAEDA